MLTMVLQVQHIIPEVTIPPEVTPENVTTYIVDSGGMLSAPFFFPRQLFLRLP